MVIVSSMMNMWKEKFSGKHKKISENVSVCTTQKKHKKIEDVLVVHILAVQNSCKNKIANCKIS